MLLIINEEDPLLNFLVTEFVKKATPCAQTKGDLRNGYRSKRVVNKAFLRDARSRVLTVM